MFTGLRSSARRLDPTLGIGAGKGSRTRSYGPISIGGDGENRPFDQLRGAEGDLMVDAQPRGSASAGSRSSPILDRNETDAAAKGKIAK